MSPSDPSDKERLVRNLLRKVDLARAGAAEPCPDENLLAGFAEGRLAPGERGPIAVHLEHCRACGAIVAELAESAVVAAGDGAPRVLPVLSRTFLLAAAALLVVGVAIGGWRILASRGPRDTQSRLVASVRTLARDHADLFSDFTPLDSTDLLVPPPTLRGGEELTLIAPTAVILEERPEFRWEPVEGATSYTVTLQGDGTPLWRATSKEPRLAWPADQAPLERGTSRSWRLEVDEPSGSSVAHQRFTVATQQQYDRFDAQKRAIAEIGDAELRPLLLAHLALSADLLREAEIAAKNFVSMRPDDLVGLETLYCVEKWIAPSAAEALREVIEARRGK